MNYYRAIVFGVSFLMATSALAHESIELTCRVRNLCSHKDEECKTPEYPSKLVFKIQSIFARDIHSAWHTHERFYVIDESQKKLLIDDNSYKISNNLPESLGDWASVKILPKLIFLELNPGGGNHARVKIDRESGKFSQIAMGGVSGEEPLFGSYGYCHKGIEREF